MGCAGRLKVIPILSNTWAKIFFRLAIQTKKGRIFFRVAIKTKKKGEYSSAWRHFTDKICGWRGTRCRWSAEGVFCATEKVVPVLLYFEAIYLRKPSICIFCFAWFILLCIPDFCLILFRLEPIAGKMSRLKQLEMHIKFNEKNTHFDNTCADKEGK